MGPIGIIMQLPVLDLSLDIEQGCMSAWHAQRSLTSYVTYALHAFVADMIKPP